MARRMSTPVVLIGLDGATFDVLDPLVAAGDMPILGALLARGARADLASVVPPITPAAWASFMTGKQPAKHGIYDFRIYDPRMARDSFVTSRAVRDRTLWQLLVAAGRRVTVVNLPMMFPPPAASGTVVSGFDMPSADVAFTSPPELRDRILARYPAYRLVPVPEPTDPSLERDDSFARFVGEVETGLEQRTWIACELLRSERPDVFMVHYQEPDVLQHVAWRFLADPALAPARHARLRQVYRRLDGLVGEVLADAPADAVVLVVSDHGFGAQEGRLFPNVLLQKLGYLSWRSRRTTRLKHSLDKRLRRLGLGQARSGTDIPWEVRVRTHGFAQDLPLRWSQTRAYVALAEIYGLLYLNLRGREPEGIVEPGAEQARLTEELRAHLLSARDPHDGGAAFAEVLPGAAVYPDDPTGRRPDLVLVPRPGFIVRRELRLSLWLERNRTIGGTHRPEGILVAAGPGIRAGRVERAAIADLAPTVLAVADVPLPDDLDGRVLTELFERPPTVTYDRATAPVAEEDAVLSEHEEAQLADRLRALGYLT
jgi:predicted AlkP superfamily phosphohydrolase/phosphomutase